MNNPYFDPTLQDAYPNVSWHPKQTPNSPNWGGAATSALGLGLNAYVMSQQGLHLNQGIAPSQYDLDSAPSYTAGNAQYEAGNAKVQGINGGEVLSGAASGAAIGSAVPVIGTAVGAVVGAVGSAVGGLLRGNKQRKEKEAALRRVMAAQQQYNVQDVAFRGQQNQRQDYLRRIDPYNREYAVNQTRFYNG